jgi:acyl-coenzyme A thioesterase PaaI-like protein
MTEEDEPVVRQPMRPVWAESPPGRLIGKGHPAGDFLETHDWDILEHRHDYLSIEAHLPHHVLNPMGQLFGGFTPTYVDLVVVLTVRPRRRTEGDSPRWLSTTNMRVDFVEPIVGPRFRIQSTLELRRNRTIFRCDSVLSRRKPRRVCTHNDARIRHESSPRGGVIQRPTPSSLL